MTGRGTELVRIAVLVLCAVIAIPGLCRADGPGTIRVSPVVLESSRLAVRENPSLSAWKGLLSDRVRAMRAPARAVVLQGSAAVEPHAYEHDADRPGLLALADSVEILALVHWLARDEQAAGKASGLLWAWYLDSLTRMIPRMDALPDPEEADAIMRTLDAARLIRSSQAWTDADQRRLGSWCGAFLDWLEPKLAEAVPGERAWLDALAGMLAVCAGRNSEAEALVSQGVVVALERINPDGSLGSEFEADDLRELAGMGALFCVAESCGVNAWDMALPGRGTFRAALDHAESSSTKEGQGLPGLAGKFPSRAVAGLFRRAALVYGHERYLNFPDAILLEASDRNLTHLAY
ncbi:alginate lyase family protein [Pseudodesulfovibrio tunisiensis]|uniref:alginate lyase family protein n=1 Tax=Pseudodesulfovibrio tunisiensis TaxID=463192 RepID=UPI001FB3E1B3|nr:alginate lyase family protein [Pseudodesulfovibrio tunisiensis]